MIKSNNEIKQIKDSKNVLFEETKQNDNFDISKDKIISFNEIDNELEANLKKIIEEYDYNIKENEEENEEEEEEEEEEENEEEKEIINKLKEEILFRQEKKKELKEKKE